MFFACSQLVALFQKTVNVLGDGAYLEEIDQGGRVSRRLISLSPPWLYLW